MDELVDTYPDCRSFLAELIILITLGRGITENVELNASKNILHFDMWSMEQKPRWTRSIKSSQVVIASNSILLDEEMCKT